VIRLRGRKKEKRGKGFLIRVVNLQNEVKIDKKYAQRVAEEAIRLGTRNKRKLGERKSEVGIIFVNNNCIRRLNRRYRRVNQITDVIAFPLQQRREFILPRHLSFSILGEVFISADRAKVQAREFGHSIKKEIAILTVHGILHLLSYDHAKKKEALAMRSKEREILSALGIGENEIG